jgi:formylglycine-generating enzyme required for sulfatase activity
MHGNVWEWCDDGKRAYQSSDISDPLGSLSDDSRVLRGGAYGSDAGACRAAFRSSNARASCGSHVGFRVCFRLD